MWLEGTYFLVLADTCRASTTPISIDPKSTSTLQLGIPIGKLIYGLNSEPLECRELCSQIRDDALPYNSVNSNWQRKWSGLGHYMGPRARSQTCVHTVNAYAAVEPYHQPNQTENRCRAIPSTGELSSWVRELQSPNWRIRGGALL